MGVRIETEVVDGKERIWFPAIAYRYHHDNSVRKYPPCYRGPGSGYVQKDGKAVPVGIYYDVIVHDSEEYLELCRLGLIYDTRHTGRWDCKLIDNRNVKV